MHERIDIASWERREIYELFTKSKQPHYYVSAYVDVTRLLEYKREHNLSFYLSFIFLASKALNTIENFKYRIVDGEVVKYDIVNVNFIHKTPDENVYHIYTCLHEENLHEFVRKTQQAIVGQNTLFAGLDHMPNLAYYSCLPLIDATALINPDLEDVDDAIPRINWGKYVLRDGRWKVNLTVAANHRFVDGYHVSLFFQRLEKLIAEL